MSEKRTAGKHRGPTGNILGLAAFEKISAVEGIRLTAGLKRDLRAMDRQKMPASDRTRLIDRKYGKKSV